jgi:hypothetical protein
MTDEIQEAYVNDLSTEWGFEYRTKLELFGWPLVHITRGYNPLTGKQRVSKGVIAIGEIAIGGLAFGGLAIGGIAFGGMGVGVIALGGLAVGGFAAGGIAFGLAAAVGSLAYSLSNAIGVLAYAPHTISPMNADPEIMNLLERFGAWIGQIR